MGSAVVHQAAGTAAVFHVVMIRRRLGVKERGEQVVGGGGRVVEGIPAVSCCP